jgi:DNA-binding transcriptional MocR family regulator
VPSQQAISRTLTDIAGAAGLDRILAYPPNTGLPGQREAMAEWLRRGGLSVSPGQIVMTNGAHHALLTALSTLARPGDRLLVEPLTYPGIQPLARLLGLRLEPVPCDESGPIPSALVAACRSGPVAALYCVPTLQNPTLRTMDAERRAEIARIAVQNDMPIVEDDIFRRLTDLSAPTIASLAPEHTYYVDSLSKTTAPGLRVGFVAGPERVAATLSHAALSSSGKMPQLPGEIARRWIEDGTAEIVLAEVREELAARLALAKDVLKNATIRSVSGAPSIWISLPASWTAADFTTAALRLGVTVTPSHPFAIQKRFETDGVRLCLGPPGTRGLLREGLSRIASLLAQRPEETVDAFV